MNISCSPPELREVPREEWLYDRLDSCRVAVSMHEFMGACRWTVFDLADLPNDFVRSEDMEFVVVMPIDRTPFYIAEAKEYASRHLVSNVAAAAGWN